MTLNDLNKAIDSVNSSAAKLMSNYQDVGIGCLTHLKGHGDVGPVNRLLIGMPKGTRKLAMASWMLAHGALTVNTDKGTKETMPLRYTKDKQTDLEAAGAEQWFEHMAEREISDVFDLQVAVKSILNRAKGKTLMLGGVNAPHEAMAALRAMAGAVGLPVEATVPEKAPEPVLVAPAATVEEVVESVAPAAAKVPAKTHKRESIVAAKTAKAGKGAKTNRGRKSTV